MKKTILVILLSLFIAAVLISCKEKTVMKTPDEKAQVSVPATWKKDVASDSPYLTLYKLEGMYFEVIPYYKTSTSYENYSLSNYVVEYMQFVKNEPIWKDITISNAENLKINNYDAIRFEIRGKFKGNYSGDYIKRLFTIVETDTAFYVMQGWGHEFLYADNKDDIIDITSTFKEISNSK